MGGGEKALNTWSAPAPRRQETCSREVCTGSREDAPLTCASPHPLLSSSLRALEAEITFSKPHDAGRSELSVGGGSLPLTCTRPASSSLFAPLPRSRSRESHALAPARGLGRAREPLVANHRAVERRALGSGALGEPAGAAFPGSLRRSHRPRQTHRLAGKRAGRHGQSPPAVCTRRRAPAPARGSPPSPKGSRGRPPRSRRPPQGGRAGGRRWGGPGAPGPRCERRRRRLPPGAAPGAPRSGAVGECAPPAVPAPDHGVRPPARVRPPRRRRGPAVGSGRAGARGQGRCPPRGAPRVGGKGRQVPAPHQPRAPHARCPLFSCRRSSCAASAVPRSPQP